MGNTATALSLALGQQQGISPINNIPMQTSTITITEVIKNPNDGQKVLIGTHMQAIQAYVSILEINIVRLLEESPSRAATLDEHIALLKHYGTKTNDSLIILDEQILDLKAIIENNARDSTESKDVLQSSLSSLNYG
jgi:hypothetical protein